MRTGGEILIDCLVQLGCDTAFGVPGESYLAALDAMTQHPDFSFVICRQEGGAAMMADAHARLTGKPGVCFVTRGPGATNASAGVHIAQQDSIPMVLFIGQVGRDMIEREAFQEIDYRRMYGQLAKWVAQIDQVERIPEFLSHAWHVAQQGRPGPVVLALPEDMLTDAVEEAAGLQPVTPALAHPGPAEMERLSALLAQAKQPLAILGGGGWTAEACKQVERFAEAHALPVAVSFRCQSLFDNQHPCYVGHVGIGIDPKLAAAVREADLLLVLGARLGEMTTSGYSLVKPPVPDQGLVHVHPGAEELGRVYQPLLGINAAMPAMAAALSDLRLGAKWEERRAALRAAYEAFRQPTQSPGPLQLSQVVRTLDEQLPEDTIHCNGAGNYSAWVHRFHPYRRFGSQLAPTSGSMGYGTPAAVAAKIARPEATVVAWAGDGCFLMNGQELATAVQYGLKILILVVNNGQYGTIRMHQEREYPERVMGTQLANPDFAALARAYGAFGETVEEDAQFAPALERAMAAQGPALIELRIDPEAITPATTLSAIRKAALERGN
ncbi:MAG: thiamine pyrophosphate-binding protein [Limibacillus sp.]